MTTTSARGVLLEAEENLQQVLMKELEMAEDRVSRLLQEVAETLRVHFYKEVKARAYKLYSSRVEILETALEKVAVRGGRRCRKQAEAVLQHLPLDFGLNVDVVAAGILSELKAACETAAEKAVVEVVPHLASLAGPGVTSFEWGLSAEEARARHQVRLRVRDRRGTLLTFRPEELTVTVLSQNTAVHWCGEDQHQQQLTLWFDSPSTLCHRVEVEVRQAASGWLVASWTAFGSARLPVSTSLDAARWLRRALSRVRCAATSELLDCRQLAEVTSAGIFTRAALQQLVDAMTAKCPPDSPVLLWWLSTLP